MRKSIYTIVFLITLLFANSNVISQVTISGPDCVVPGVTYTYNITGKWDSFSSMKLCVTGGVIADSTGITNCTPTDIPLNAVTVIWKNAKNGSLALTSSAGNNILNIKITLPLSGGSLDSVSKIQKIHTDSIPSVIICSAAKGGSCSPSYFYQWQKSYDVVSWIDIPMVTSQNLAIDSVLRTSTYYRRKVTENVSGSIGYSNVASVFVVTIHAASDTSKSSKDSSSSGMNLLRTIKTVNGNIGFPDNKPVEKFLTQLVFSAGKQSDFFIKSNKLYTCA